ncbi:hypothetical protein VF21_08462 [Pseudogymnoascus sp. 05NY08]|nr:hypothetical protein VF21_08462 [Pseudogymnoascus sp. 05NY08]
MSASTEKVVTMSDHIEHPRESQHLEVEKVSTGADAAVEALRGQDLDYTEEENRRVLRKIDLRLMPLMAFACGIQLVDKSGLGAAATYGLRESIGLVGDEYSWCVTIFYFGYLAGSFISGRGLQNFHAGKFMGVYFVAWGATLLGCIGVQNYSGLLVLRFLLGFFESALVPGLLLITTMWYNHKEQPFRFGLWTVLNGLLPIPFLVIYYGLGNIKNSIEPWRLIFLMIGLVSVLYGVVIYFFLPDSPLSVSWLNDREKAVAVQRVAKDQTGVKNAQFKWEQAREALTDYKVWLIVLSMLFSQAAGSVTTNFLGIIINGFGFSPLTTQLLTAPNFAVQAITQILVSALPTFSKRFRNLKQPLTAFASVIALIGIVIIKITPPTTENQYRRLAGVIIISCSGVNYTVIMSIIGTNIGGFTKKQFTTSMAFFMYCVINIITPQTFLGAESPSYSTGLTFVMSLLSLFIVTIMASWFSMLIENRRRDKLALTDPSYATGDDNMDLMSGLRDQTDSQNKHHRYSG